MAKELKKSDQLFEQFRAGLVLTETARFTTDKKLAVVLAKQGFALVQSAAAAISDIPEDWCGTGPKGPWRGPRRLDFGDATTNPILELKNIEVLGILENMKGNILSPQLGEIVKGLSKTTLGAISL
jgi:hypothetical protein